ncbi:hypothetical protein BOW53_04400 [Solemya pervernicosa gill symbiont]|uniref:EAL domain-containing protein n=2 Tax=Gammaproteobacteria incertae sedis TaxID=118884 RepID=A0A1T2L8K0_9GAMM|nr:EAL domain-containing protein [Candidatus Reidiella endopervernicosa]OOZ41362.1 hypothetical protein BOW53_04400 [Solemya pervernicosa gill symbiont]QKQ27740.1 EAL domain-containing protein [Candidatus Reidiella endopervernicosa]
MKRAIFNAINNDELEMYYQPKFNPVTEEVTGLEAFVRWNHPDGHQLQAGEFIHVIEKDSELSLALDNWVLNHTLAQATDWTDKQYGLEFISINLSSWIQTDALTSIINNALTNTAYPSNKLSFECPWRILEMDTTLTTKTMRKIRESGACIITDGAPLDASALITARNTPIKLSKVCYTTLHKLIDESGVKAVSTQIRNWKKSGIKIAAVGVENDSEHELARQIDCHLSQGNRFKAPLSATDITALLVMIMETKIAFGI